MASRPLHHPDYAVCVQVLRGLRLERKLTQAQLAIRLGVDQSFVSRVERLARRVDIAETRQICAAMDVSLADFASQWEAALVAPDTAAAGARPRRARRQQTQEELRMHHWRCQAPGCESVASILGELTDLRKRGWEVIVRARPGGNELVVLLCPKHAPVRDPEFEQAPNSLVAAEPDDVTSPPPPDTDEPKSAAVFQYFAMARTIRSAAA